MNPKREKRMNKILILIATIFLLGSCSVHRVTDHHSVSYQVVDKTKKAKVYHNSDGVYYARNDVGLWMVWMDSTTRIGGSSYSSVTYSSAPRFTSTPDFSKGSFVPVSGQPSLSNMETSGKAFTERDPNQTVGQGGFGKSFDPERDAKTQEEVEAPEETLETSMGTEVSPDQMETEIATESQDSGSFSTTSSTDSVESSGGDSGGGDSGGGGD
jgi:uncharacterized membrane protein YgcG